VRFFEKYLLTLKINALGCAPDADELHRRKSMNQADMVKLMRRENNSLATAYENAVCWLAFSVILNVALIIALLLD
jgi:hypothetical protein